MIIDCFMFFNEYDILEGRLKYLYNTVDYFVIVESNITHSGKSKPLNYLANVDRYQQYAKKILYFPLAIDSKKYNWNIKSTRTESYSPSWAVENLQRNHIAKALELFSPDDIVIISDVDEIPNKHILTTVIDNLTVEVPAITLIQDMFYYNFNQKQVIPWSGSVVTTNKSALERKPQWFRSSRSKLPTINNGGWHLSYWGDVEHIKNKLNSFAHQEYNTEQYNSIENIQSAIEQGKDLFGRLDNQFVKFDKNTLPKDFLLAFDKSYTVKHIPHFYKKIDGFFNDHDFIFLRKMLEKFSGPAHFVEIGSYKGLSSSYMAVEIVNSGKSITFDCVDTWQGSEEHQQGQSFEDLDVVNNQLYEVFIQNMKPVEGYYNAKRMSSVEAAETYLDNSLDFVFIDAAHDYDNVKQDIISWLPKVKKDGIISGHDYPHLPVRQAVNELLTKVGFIGACWWVVK
jgi:beta-1,4-mannosyl-glycoprotein beta-1,4-N-acetylglucosaminyltransferase